MQAHVSRIAGTNGSGHAQAKPGVRDNVNFKQHWSVAEWRNYTWPPPGGKLSTREGAQIVLREATERARAANVLQDSTSATYWAYHVARLTFFLLQSFSAVVAQALRSGAARTGRAQWIFGEMSAEKMLDSLALVRFSLGTLAVVPAHSGSEIVSGIHCAVPCVPILRHPHGSRGKRARPQNR